MLKQLLTSAAIIALATGAAVADPSATADETQVSPAMEPAAEMPQYEPQRVDAAATIAPIDVTTKDDAQRLADAQFAAADVNADGMIDPGEFAAYAVAQSAAGEPLSAEAEITVEAEPADAAFAAIANGDQKISKDELTEAREQDFAEADVNADATLDASEQKKFAALVTVTPAEPLE